MAKTELVWTQEIKIKYRAEVGPLIVVVSADSSSSDSRYLWWVLDRLRECEFVAKGEHESLTAALREAEEAALRIVKAEAEAAKGAE